MARPALLKDTVSIPLPNVFNVSVPSESGVTADQIEFVAPGLLW